MQQYRITCCCICLQSAAATICFHLHKLNTQLLNHQIIDCIIEWLGVDHIICRGGYGLIPCANFFSSAWGKGTSKFPPPYNPIFLPVFCEQAFYFVQCAEQTIFHHSCETIFLKKKTIPPPHVSSRRPLTPDKNSRCWWWVQTTVHAWRWKQINVHRDTDQTYIRWSII